MENQTPHKAESPEKYIYLMPQGMEQPSVAEDEIDLAELGRALWAGRRLIAIITTICVSVAIAYALLATEWYQAEVVLAPVGKKSVGGGLAQLGGLASLAGIDLPGADAGEPMAVLKSKDFAREFIEEKKLLPLFFEQPGETFSMDTDRVGGKSKDIRDGVKYFDSIRTITEDKKSGTITLAIKWKDPVLAASWANELVKRLNDRMRSEAIDEAQKSIEYLQKEMLATTVVTLQQSIGRVLESEMQKMALARAKEEFALKVIDPAVPPKYRAWPKRSLIVLVSGLLGLMLGAMVVLIQHSRRSQVTA